MKQNKIFLKLACTFTAISMLLPLVACGKNDITSESTAVVKVETSNPEIADINRSKDFVGRVIPDDMVAVMANMPNKVVAIHKNVGDYVKQGELLFEVDNEKMMQSVELAQSGLQIALLQSEQAMGSTLDMSILQAEIAYKSADMEYDNLKDEYDILDDYTEEQIAAMGGEDVYDAQIDAMKAKLDSARIKLHYAKDTYERAQTQNFDEAKSENDSSIKKAEAALKSAMDAMEETKVYAPVSGIIQQSNLTLHETPSAQDAAMIIAGDNIRSVKIGIPERYINNVSKGDKVVFKYAQKEYEGIVSEVGVAINEKSGLVDVKVSLEDTERVFATGSAITVTLVVEKAQNVLTIPYDALHLENGEAYVYVAKDEKAMKKVVELGVLTSKTAEILSGLESSDVVITTQSSALGDGVDIKILGNDVTTEQAEEVVK